MLLHGFTGSSAAWPQRLLDGVAAAGRPPVLVDLPGHGRHARESRASRLSLAAALAVIGRAADGPVELAGYSMGGRLALHFALAFPGRVERLVLESASPGLETDRERARRRASDEELATRIEREGIEPFVDYWEAQPLFESQSRLDRRARTRLRRVRLANDAVSLAGALRALGTGSLPSLWDRLGEVTTPTLLLAGALDPKFVGIAERMVSLMPHARLVVVPDAGHAVHLERPDAWLAAVMER